MSSRVPPFFLGLLPAASAVLLALLLAGASDFLDPALLATALLEVALLEARLALDALERDGAGAARTTRDCPGRISARRKPLAFISAAVVVWYRFAMPPKVSPDFTMWVNLPREVG